MITLVEARNYRCLHYVRRPLRRFQVLVGPNASGKTTFLDVVGFLGKLVSDGLDAAISDRAQQFRDLLWQHNGDRFEIAVQAKIPDRLREVIFDPDYIDVRYEVAIGEQDNESVILEEKILFLKPQEKEKPTQRILFPELPQPPLTIMKRGVKKGVKVIVNKKPGGNDNYYSEKVRDAGKSWAPSFRLGPRKSAFGNLVDDVERFPVCSWFRDYLSTGVQSFMLNSVKLRQMSPPGQGKGFATDGANLPWVIEDLRKKDPKQFELWVDHLRTALPDIQSVSTEARPDTNHRYITVRYAGGLEVPSWMVSDGTLRMLALTLPAYLPDYSGVFLIEEPENGIDLTPRNWSSSYVRMERESDRRGQANAEEDIHDRGDHKQAQEGRDHGQPGRDGCSRV